MRGKRRTRGSQGTWLPTIGDQIVEEDPGPAQARSGRSISLGLTGGAAGFSTGVISLTTDRPRQDPTEADSLADVIGSEWFLKRIVGSCFVSRKAVTGSGNPLDAGSPLLVGCGFFVARTDPANPDNPIGFTETQGEEVAYNPLNERNIREPWIWRRTWVLGYWGRDPSTFATPTAGIEDSFDSGNACFPPSNALYGSVADGPKIDAKTKRRITNDDRLFFAASLCRYGFDFNDNATAAAEVYLDYRLFGQNRRPRNRGNF